MSTTPTGTVVLDERNRRFLVLRVAAPRYRRRGRAGKGVAIRRIVRTSAQFCGC